MFRWLMIVVGLAFVLVPSDHAAAGEKRIGDAYPLANCPVSGQKLGAMGDPVVYLHEGREIRFCCKGCIGKFKKAPADYLAKIDARIVKEQTPTYPLTTCVASGEKIGGGEMKPIDVVSGNRLVRLCCKGCTRDLKKTPEAMIAKLDKAVIEKQKKAYPLETCVISGRKLGAMGAVVEIVHANRLVRLCCKGCVKGFEKDPRAAFAKIDAAAKYHESEDAESHGEHDRGGGESGGHGGHGGGGHGGR